jgi:hypothetical protein
MPTTTLAAATASSVVTATSVMIRGDASEKASCNASWNREGRLGVLAQWRMCCARLSRSTPIWLVPIANDEDGVVAAADEREALGEK